MAQWSDEWEKDNERSMLALRQYYLFYIFRDGVFSILTDSAPSRFNIPESVLRSCSFRSSFEDVTYETEILCSYESMNATLQPEHHNFLKKLKESPQKRSFASALFSPFDKYTTPYNVNVEGLSPKKREPASSYLSSMETPPCKKLSVSKPAQAPKKSIAFARELETIVECSNSFDEEPIELSPTSSPVEPSNSVEIDEWLPAPCEVRAASIDGTLKTANDLSDNCDMQIQAPISPIADTFDDPSRVPFGDNARNVELTELNIVAVPVNTGQMENTPFAPDKCVPTSSPIVDGAFLPNESPQLLSVKLKVSDLEDVTTIDAGTCEVELAPATICTPGDRVKPTQCKVSVADKTEAKSHQIEPVDDKAIELVGIEPCDSPVAGTPTKFAVSVVANAAEAPRIEFSITENGASSAVIGPSICDTSATKNVGTSEELVPSTRTAQNIREENPIVTAGVEIGSQTCSTIVEEERSQNAGVPEIESRCYLPVGAGVGEMVRQCVRSDIDASEISLEQFHSPTSIGTSPQELPPAIASSRTPWKLSTTAKMADTSQKMVLTAETDFNFLDTATLAIPASITSLQYKSDILVPSEASFVPNTAENRIDEIDVSAGASISCGGTAKSSANGGLRNPVDAILSDSNVFTIIDKKSVSQISTDPNSRMFALKVKGTEDAAQLSQLVDLCRKNPLFKNKNVKFKIVPVKSSVSKTLLLPEQVSSASSRVHGGETRSANANGQGRPDDAASTAQVSAVGCRRRGRVSSIGNVTGPWECVSCCGKSDSRPLKFRSYSEYRLHLHDVHKVADSPVYCAHCGYKSLKRNQQLYHLLTEHDVRPPSNFTFPKCDECGMWARNEYQMRKHRSSHQQPAGMEYVCSCRAAFESGELLQRHIAVDDCRDSSGFSCGHCSSQFSRVVNLKAHLRVCAKERSKPPLLQNTTGAHLTSSATDEQEMILS